MALVTDRFERPLRNLRLSVTDRCNLRCLYCMPEEEYVWLAREHLLTFEEIARLAKVFAGLGVHRLRLTGGEPLLRRDLDQLVRLLKVVEGIDEIALTTNGLLLAGQAAALKEAGLDRVTVSLDTLRPDRFERLTRRSGHHDVVAGIEAARAAGFTQTKIDSVILRGVNDDELLDLLDYGRRAGAEVRFIEYMDVGGATRWKGADVVARDEILAKIGAACGRPRPLDESGSQPAQRWRLPDGTIFGTIASTTSPFCASCDRARLTADGQWYLCLYATKGLDLCGPLRSGASREELARLIAPAWHARSDRGAEERLRAAARGVFQPAAALRSDPHLEMHTRGG
jgi:cyclic pyranopterin phosphate synthase